MGKKKKVKKITDEQYLSYIAGLKNDAALFSADGEMLVPDSFGKNAEDEEEKQKR